VHPQLTRATLDPPESSNQTNGISIGLAIFAGFTIVTDRQTDRPRYSVCNNRRHLYVRSIAMRHKRKCDKHRNVTKTRMWANAQRDGRPAEYKWRPLFNAAKCG